MSSKSKKKKVKAKDTDWIYDPIVVKGILKAKKEAEEDLKQGKKLITMDELLEEFKKEDERNNIRKKR